MGGDPEVGGVGIVDGDGGESGVCVERGDGGKEAIGCPACWGCGGGVGGEELSAGEGIDA